MKNRTLTKLIMAVVAIAALVVSGVSHAQVSKLSELKERLIYSRAFEVILWGSPALAILAQQEAGHRDLGAGNTDIVYTRKPLDYRWGPITYNNQSPYWGADFSVKDGPVVVEIPAAIPEARFFGSIHDVWYLPLKDFGPAGADKGAGGKYLVLPPGYEGKIPDGYIVLRSPSYNHHIPGRTIPRDPGQAGWDAAVEYIKQVRIYPLAQADNPPEQRFIDGTQRKYDAQPQFDLSDFYLLDRLVQEEPIQEHDKIMYGMLETIGIRKGQKFAPSPEVVKILERAARDAQDYMISHMQSGESFAPFWQNGVWGSFKITSDVAATLLSFSFEDRLTYEDRARNHFYFSGGMYKSFDATRPSATAYMMTAQDSAGDGLDPSQTYRMHVPADPPTKDFWSVIAYGLKSRTFINSPKITVSSNDEDVKVNKDGSIDLYLSPKPVKGFEANTVIMNPAEPTFLMFRFYGAKPELWEKKWVLGDPELVQ